MSDLRPVALITGASGGIGAELARVFARHGHGLALAARDESKMQALALEIGASGGAPPEVIGLDLQAAGAAARLAAILAERQVSVRYLVNNAGYGLVGAFDVCDLADQLGVIDLNIRVLTELCRIFLRDITLARGGILNVASIAGFTPGPNMAVYYASKAYVVSFSQALHQELKGKGVAVTALCPGPVATGFGARAGIASDMSAGIPKLSAAEVAERGYRALIANRRIEAPGVADKLLRHALPLVPNALVLPILARIQAQRKRA